MPPPRPYQHIDTLKAAYEVLYPTSAKLDYMTKWLGLPNKLPTDYDLWLGCMQGDKESLNKMNEYGLNDTWILEQYYTEIRAWIPRHPNMSAWENRYVSLDEGEHPCPVCRFPIAETSLTGKPYRTPTGYRFQSFRCGNCGAAGRKTKRIGGQSI